MHVNEETTALRSPRCAATLEAQGRDGSRSITQEDGLGDAGALGKAYLPLSAELSRPKARRASIRQRLSAWAFNPISSLSGAAAPICTRSHGSFRAIFLACRGIRDRIAIQVVAAIWQILHDLVWFKADDMTFWDEIADHPTIF
jgi:hypothetical protein